MVHAEEHWLREQLALPCPDPLGAYIEFLDKTRPLCPDTQYKMHLQRCLAYFKGYERYKNDPRYTDLWLQAAAGPETFKFMAQNDIGLRSPAFYAAYSRTLATRGYLAQALKVRERGELQCVNILYSVEYLRDLAAGLQDPDPIGVPLPPGPDPRPSSAEQLSISLDLLIDPITEIESTFTEVIMNSRGVKLSPTPRRLDPTRPPPPAPEKFDYDLPNTWEPQQAKTQVIKRRYKPPPPLNTHPTNHYPGATLNSQNTAGSGQFSSSASSSTTSSTPATNPSGSIGSQKSQSGSALAKPSKMLQVLEFDKQPPAALVIPQRQPIPVPAVVDASLTTTRQAFAGLLQQTLREMGPVFVQNQVARNGQAYLAKPNLPEDFELTNITIRVRKIIGSGGYGTVFSAVNPVNNTRYALKLEKGNIPWEWYVVSMARSRLSEERALHSIIHCYYYEGYVDEQYILMPLIGYDSLLAVANYMRSRTLSSNDTEVITAYFAIELLRTVRALHSNKIIHGDLKAENVMLRAPADKSIHSGYLGRLYSVEGGDKWNEYGVLLIDFGRSIDMELFPPGQRFEATWSIDDDQDCWEMRKKLPWTYQPDYFGIASIAHLLLFGKYLKIRESVHSKSISESYKRGMNSELWTKFFDTLLNPTELPLLGGMESLQHLLEGWLRREGGKIHHLLTDIAYDVRKKRLI